MVVKEKETNFESQTVKDEKNGINNGQDDHNEDNADYKGDNGNNLINVKETGTESDANGEEEKALDLAKELEDCKDKLLRISAEFENFKKRMKREKEEHIKFAIKEFAKELLPFLDNIERAMSTAKETSDIDKLIEGIELAVNGYFKTLEKFGLKQFQSYGRQFDPSLHEALGVEETDDFEENTVVKEMLKGYTLHDRVLRPALVIVSKKNL